MTLADPASRNKSILLVEDLPFDVYLTIRALESCVDESDIYPVRDGWDALLVMRERIFDLILLDLKMPRVDGFEMMELMNVYQLQRGVPVIILSNSNLDSDRKRSQELGAAGYVNKSLNRSEYESTLCTMLLHHGWLKDNQEYSDI